MKVIVTGATGMVGEGVRLECLDNPAVDKVLSVSRRPSGHSQERLEELLVADFRELGPVEPRLAGCLARRLIAQDRLERHPELRSR